MTNATSNFIALAAPDWLQHDMAQAAPILPGVRTLVMFRNEIDRKSPTEHLKYLLQRSFGLNSDIAHNMARQVDGHNHDAFLLHDAPRQDRVNACPVTGHREERTTILVAPRHALIVLPDSQQSTADLIRRATGLTTVRPDAGNFHRGAFWHEFGHLRMAAQAGNIIRARLDEQNADLSVRHGCRLVQDQASLHTFMNWRLLSNFTSPVSPKSSIYWNDLSLLGVKDATEADSIASLLELKLRAAGGKPHTDDPQTFASKMMADPRYTGVRSAFQSLHNGPERMLQQLAEQHYRGYTFRHSRTLAQVVLTAAQKLSPLAL